MRPRGEVRDALAAAIERLVEDGSAVTHRQVAEAALVGYRVARTTLNNMRRAGELQVVGHDKQAGSRRWMAMYALPAPGPADHTSFLTNAMHQVASTPAPALAMAEET